MSCASQHCWNWVTPVETSESRLRSVPERYGAVLPGRSQPIAGRRILIIEDCEDTANSLREVLELEGYRVEEALNGPDGLTKARCFQPEVVLCDLGLPGMDGYAVARAFRTDRVLIGCVLIALSGYAQPDDVRRAIAAGFRCHMAKPANIDVLYRMLAGIPLRPR
ncbi:MAG TPA: response regulator [Polyangiaceae bacterium]|nr:response regulator [Polyangiaceae bacterium]